MECFRNYQPSISGPRTITRKQQQELVKFNFKIALKLFFSNQFSIIYTLTNFFLPFFLCLIGSCIKPNGVLIVIVIGLTSSFYTIFNQLAMVLSQILSRRVIKEFRNPLFPAHDLSSRFRGALINVSLIVGVIYGLIMAGLFMLSAGLYTHYISIYKNLQPAGDYAWILVASLLPTIFLVYINDILLVEIYLNYGNVRSVIVLLSQYFLRLVLVTLFSLNTNIGILGIGLGMMGSSLFDLFVDILMISNKANIFKVDKLILKINLREDLMMSWIYILRFLFGYIAKSIMVLITGIATSAANKDIYATMIIARIIWYNILFSGGWFADACVLQTALYKLMYWHDRIFPLNYASLMKFNLVLGTFLEFFTLMGFGFLVPDIAQVYIQNLPIDLNGNVSESFQLVTKWSINSMMNIPLTDAGNYIASYVQGGSYTMIYLGAFVWLYAMGKLGTLTPYTIAHPRKTDIYVSYISSPLAVITIITSLMLTKGITTGFWSYLQGFTFPLMFVALILFIIGLTDAISLLKYLRSPLWLDRFNHYETTNPIMYKKWHFGEYLRKQLSSL